MSAPLDVRTCPYCGGKHTSIRDSRVNVHDGYLIRYRLCARCKQTYRTYEINADEWKKVNELRYVLQSIIEKSQEALNHV